MDCLKMVKNTLLDFSCPKVNFQMDFSMVRIVDGARKLGHFFLFDNALACTKPVLTGSRLDFHLKWVLKLSQVRSNSDKVRSLVPILHIS